MIVSRQPRGALLSRDELAGWLQGMTRYSGGGWDRPFWLEAYGGRGYTVERMGRDPVHVDRLSVGVIGGIQPERLRTLLMKSDDDGLLARFLPIWPNPAPIRRPCLMHDELFMENALGRLLMLDMPMDGDGQKRPWFIPFTEEARNLMDEFRQAVRRWEETSEGLLKSFVGKLTLEWQSELPLSSLSLNGLPMKPKSRSRSASFTSARLLIWLRPTCFQWQGDPTRMRPCRRPSVAARRLVALIREQGWRQFGTREVLRLNRPQIGTSDELDPAVVALEESDVIRGISSENAGRGRPARIFAVNPSILGRR